MLKQDTIIALATPAGVGAIAVIRISGDDAINIVSKFFKSISGKKLNAQKTHTIHLGHIVTEDVVLDEVLVSVFKNPKSYTGENVVEISCHGSTYIQQEIIQLYAPLVSNGGALIYATCSVLPSENQQQIDFFLKSDIGKTFRLEEEKSLFTHTSGGDGFYMARLIKE